ncbi:MAG TPA: LutB/LldF family L-lactate oxidation iron-sulfur protein [Pyrinomonadaceae bacterium]|nr:LutB/LldF family L-lactate oxidation iron-sulfur protein [Pyrinomonadaceae bacterium]
MSAPTHASGESFAELSRDALNNPTLQRALSNATGQATRARNAAVAEGGEARWQRLRERAREIKEHTVNHLEHYLREFAARVEARGGRVHWAATAEDASRHVVEIARRAGATSVVKSKSMMTEEVGLNAALAAAGIEPVETDLGEYIVQLAGERPSHINMPAIHKTREDVADLFADRLRVERPRDIPEMAALARRMLRERFASARVGVTGVNYAVAETGTVVLVENEGNIRLTTSLPRVHVALMGIEKVVPTLADVDVFLRLLSRSASGQKLCSYVSFLTGPRRAPDEEGPEEFHVVLIDNGRVSMLADPHLRESLYCIRCGACLNVCPVYQKIGGHAYGWVYPGPIGAVLTPQMIGRARAADLPFASSLCGACREACPVKIDIPSMLLRLRHEVKEGPAEAPGEHAGRRRGDAAERTLIRLWSWTMRSPRRYARASRLLRFLQNLFGRKGAGGRRALPVPGWDAARAVPPLAARSFRETWRERHGKGDD